MKSDYRITMPPVRHCSKTLHLVGPGCSASAWRIPFQPPPVADKTILPDTSDSHKSIDSCGPGSVGAILAASTNEGDSPVKIAPVFLRQALTAVLFAALCACSKSTETTSEATTVTAAPTTDVAAAVAAAQKRDDPCAFVTEAEMRAILHAAVVPHVSGGNKCVYELPSGPGPYSEIEVARGDGRIAMKSAGAMTHAQPGITNPLAGVGDQAVQVGPTIMVRKGEDLVNVVMSGVDAPIAKAKLIYSTVAKRL